MLTDIRGQITLRQMLRRMNVSVSLMKPRKSFAATRTRPTTLRWEDFRPKLNLSFSVSFTALLQFGGSLEWKWGDSNRHQKVFDSSVRVRSGCDPSEEKRVRLWSGHSSTELLVAGSLGFQVWILASWSWEDVKQFASSWSEYKGTNQRPLRRRRCMLGAGFHH